MFSWASVLHFLLGDPLSRGSVTCRPPPRCPVPAVHACACLPASLQTTTAGGSQGLGGPRGTAEGGPGARPQTPSRPPPRSAGHLKKAAPWRERGRGRKETQAGGASASPRPGRGSGVSWGSAGLGACVSSPLPVTPICDQTWLTVRASVGGPGLWPTLAAASPEPRVPG